MNTEPRPERTVWGRDGLPKDNSPIDGVVLVGQDPDLLVLAVRLPPALQDLTPVIVAQVEREAAQPPRGFE